MLYASGGTANQTEDIVYGINAGLGFTGGQLKGGFQDFIGESKERSTTFIAPSLTNIETSTSKKGTAFSFGGKGFGLSFTSITTETFNLIERLKNIFNVNCKNKK